MRGGAERGTRSGRIDIYHTITKTERAHTHRARDGLVYRANVGAVASLALERSCGSLALEVERVVEAVIDLGRKLRDQVPA